MGAVEIESDRDQKKDRVIWAWYPVMLLTAVFCCVLWGSAVPAIKIAYELFRIGPEDTGSRILLAGARFMIAGVMTIAAGSVLAGKLLVPKRGSWKKVAVLALVQTVAQYYFFFMALANASGVRSSIIVAAGNFFTILFAAYIFRFEKMTFRKLLGCLVGFAGILTILGGGKALMEGGRVTLAGEGAMLASDFFYAATGCLIKIFSRDENPVTLNGYQFFIGGVILAGIRNRKAKKGILLAAIISLPVVIALCGGIEFALDRMSISHYVLYAIMTAALAVPVTLGIILLRKRERGAV